MSNFRTYLYPTLGLFVGLITTYLFFLLNESAQKIFLFIIFPVIFLILGYVWAKAIHYKEKYFHKDLEFKKLKGLSSIIKLSENIGHEFNNPLTIILGQVYLYRELNRPSNKEDICYKRLLIIENEAKKLNNITEKLIALSKASNLFNYVKIDLNHLAEKISNLKREELRKANIDYSIKIENGDQIISIDVNGILEVCTQLFDNALYFTKNVKVPRIRLSMSTNGVHLKIVIEDNGVGIQEDIRDKIFGPLFTTKKNHEGIGLGLFIAQRIAEAMNGTLTYVPKAEGAAFELQV